MKNGIVDLKKPSETSLLKDKRNPITMLVLMIFSSSNTYAMEKNTDPLIMMPDSTPQLSLFIFAIIILCATSFNQEKGGHHLVKEPDFLSKLTQFIENTRDQMVDYPTILNLASDFISNVDQYPLTTAVVASLVTFAKPTIWTKENQKIVSKWFNKKKPDNKSLSYRAQQQHLLETTINANSKPQQVLMLRGITKGLKRATNEARKALQRNQAAPGAASKLMNEMVQNRDNITVVTRTDSNRVVAIAPQEQVLPMGHLNTNEPHTHLPQFNNAVRAQVVIQFQNWIMDEPDITSRYKGIEILKSAFKQIYGKMDQQMQIAAEKGVMYLRSELNSEVTIESLLAVDRVLNLKGFKNVELLKKKGLVKSPTNKHSEQIANALHLILVAMGVSDNFIETKPIKTVVDDAQLRLFCYGRKLRMGQYSSFIPLLHTIKQFISAYINMGTDSSLLEYYTLLLSFKIIQMKGNLGLLESSILRIMGQFSCSTQNKSRIITDTIRSINTDSYVMRSNRDDNDRNDNFYNDSNYWFNNNSNKKKDPKQ